MMVVSVYRDEHGPFAMARDSKHPSESRSEPEHAKLVFSVEHEEYAVAVQLAKNEAREKWGIPDIPNLR